MYEWEDGWEYWPELMKAEIYIWTFMSWTPYYLSMKEKYGSIRYEHVFLKWNWLAKKLRNTKYIYILERWGWKLVAYAIKKATKKWPMIKKELVMDFSYPELLSKELETIHNSCWIKTSIN